MSWSPTVLNQTPATTETVFDEVRAGGHTAGALELVLNISVDPAVEAAFDAAIKSVQCYLPSRPSSMTMQVTRRRPTVSVSASPSRRLVVADASMSAVSTDNLTRAPPKRQMFPVAAANLHLWAKGGIRGDLGLLH